MRETDGLTKRKSNSYQSLIVIRLYTQLLPSLFYPVIVFFVGYCFVQNEQCLFKQFVLRGADLECVAPGVQNGGLDRFPTPASMLGVLHVLFNLTCIVSSCPTRKYGADATDAKLSSTMRSTITVADKGTLRDVTNIDG